MTYLRCFATIGCPELSLDEVLALATKHGMGGVELRALGGSMDLPAYFAAQFRTPAALADKLRGHPVRVIGLSTSAHLAGGTESERAALLDFLPWAEALGVPWLRVFDGKGPMAEADAIAGAADTLRWWRTVRRERGLRTDLMVETHETLLTTSAILGLLAAAPGTAILWDTHHTWRKGGEDPVATWRAIRGSVVHLHVKDSISVPGPKHPYTFVLPGAGEFPMTALRAALTADNYPAGVSLEWEKLWHKDLPPLDAALSAAAKNSWW
ncbi:MAG: sugar phosphate isomerase/epimerase [Opitutus sp.]|nr:sugar phosphate isomerase/epimerase [Opitutus sp.]